MENKNEAKKIIEIYSNLDEKDSSIYFNHVNEFITKICSKAIASTYQPRLFYNPYFIIENEIELRNSTIDNISLIKQFLVKFKRNEIKCINNDDSLDIHQKNEFQNGLDSIFKPLYIKLTLTSNKFNDEISKLKENLGDSNTTTSEIPTDFMEQDINNKHELCNKIRAEFLNIINDSNIVKAKKLKKLNATDYKFVVGLTLKDFCDAQKILIPENKFTGIAKQFIKILNQYIQAENQKQ